MRRESYECAKVPVNTSGHEMAEPPEPEEELQLGVVPELHGAFPAAKGKNPSQLL